jgi:hypothetical protein
VCPALSAACGPWPRTAWALPACTEQLRVQGPEDAGQTMLATKAECYEVWPFLQPYAMAAMRQPSRQPKLQGGQSRLLLPSHRVSPASTSLELECTRACHLQALMSCSLHLGPRSSTIQGPPGSTVIVHSNLHAQPCGA